MIFYNSSTGQGLCQEIDRLCDSDDTAYTRLAKTSRVNNSLEELAGEIINADGFWQWDDTNQTDLPIGTGTLVEGQESYSFASEYLQIEAVEVKDTNSVFVRLKPLDHRELGGLSPDEYFGVDSSGNPDKGMPEYYDKVGDTIFLYPAPAAANVTLASGLKVWFKRTAKLFTAASNTDTDSTEPGLPSPFHVILAYMAAVPYCAIYKKDRVPFLTKRIAELKDGLLRHFAHREKDLKYRITTNQKNYR